MIEPPAKRARISRLNNRRLARLRLPSELIEEILLNLPLKSLLRFSTVSKSWNSMIFDPVFARKHKNRAALLRRHRLVVCLNNYNDFETVSAACFLAPISSDLRIKVRKSDPSFSVFSNAKDDVLDFVGQFEREPFLLAYCDELWCVQVKKSLFLWNPSMRNIVQLPRPSSFTRVDCRNGFSYGLAYDSVSDDYKILKIGNYPTTTAELYSLKNDCWRKIELVSSSPQDDMICVFIGGRFHWSDFTTARTPIIAYFDLSSEMYGEVALPRYENEGVYRRMKVVGLRGMLCACVNYFYNEDEFDEAKGRFVLWVMEEYGVEKSWAKRFDFMIPHTTREVDHEYGCGLPPTLTPLYLYDNNDLLVKMDWCCGEHYTYILMYKNGEARPMKIVKYENWKENMNYEVNAFLYVESLITHNIFQR